MSSLSVSSAQEFVLTKEMDAFQDNSVSAEGYDCPNPTP